MCRDDASDRLAHTPDQRLRKRERLLKRHEFLKVQRRGRRRYERLFIIAWTPSAFPWTRLGVTVSKKVGTSVVRSRVKRLLREAFRRNKTHFPPARDIVIIASPSLAHATYHQVEGALLRWAEGERARRHRSRSG